MLAGFDEYSCSCVPGTYGDYCEVNVNECMSNPCPELYNCVDLIGGYDCVCGDICPVESSGPWLEAWQIALICLGVLLPLLVIATIIFCRERSKVKKLIKVAPAVEKA